MLRDSSALDILCDRLDQLMGAINKCVRKHGEGNVLGELDEAVPPCDGACDFHPFTSLIATKAFEGKALQQAAVEAVEAARLAVEADEPEAEAELQSGSE